MMSLNQSGPSPRSLGSRSETELVSLVKSGDSAAFDTLADRYQPVLGSRAARYASLAGVDLQDFMQEGMLALYRAAQTFDERHGAQFGTYAAVCISNSMSSAFRRHRKDWRAGALLNLDDMDDRELLELTSSCQAAKTAEDLYLDEEAARFRTWQIETLLSEFERQVLSLYLRGESYRSMACTLSTTTKAVDNALQRVRRKLKPE